MWSLLFWLCFVALSSPANCQEADLDHSEQDYSTKLQQFLLQTLKEAETWAGEEEVKRGRQDLTEEEEDDDDELPEIIDEELTDNDDSIVEEEEGEEETEDQGEGEEAVEGSAVEETESSEEIVLNSAPFLMSSLVSELSADIVLQEVTGSDRLTMICKVSITGQSLMFSDPACLPQIYLVAGQTDCNSLTQVTTSHHQPHLSSNSAQHFQEFSAKKLASVHGPGEGKTTVDATWAELPGKCLVVLRETDCQDSTGDVEQEEVVVEVVEVVEVEEEEEEVIVDARRQARVGNILTPASLGRSYSTFSLTSFSILSSGTSSRNNERVQG